MASQPSNRVRAADPAAGQCCEEIVAKTTGRISCPGARPNLIGAATRAAPTQVMSRNAKPPPGKSREAVVSEASNPASGGEVAVLDQIRLLGVVARLELE